jgi:hypothetical protein
MYNFPLNFILPLFLCIFSHSYNFMYFFFHLLPHSALLLLDYVTSQKLDSVTFIESWFTSSVSQYIHRNTIPCIEIQFSRVWAFLQSEDDEQTSKHVMNTIFMNIFFLQWLFQPIQGPSLLFSSVIIFHRQQDSTDRRSARRKAAT